MVCGPSRKGGVGLWTCIPRMLMYCIIGFQHKAVFWEVVEALGNEASLEEVGHYEGALGGVLSTPCPVELSAT